MKKKILIALLVVAVCVCAFAFGVTASDAPSLTVAKASLSLEEAVYVNFKVSFEGIAEENAKNIKLLVWEGAEEGVDYTKATKDTAGAVTLSVAATQTIDNVVYECFQYTGVAAKEMGKTLYARAYYEVDETNVIYSDAVRYSVVQYLENKKDDTEIGTLAASIRAYGAAAQAYFKAQGEDVGISVSENLYTVTLEGGTFADGFATGTFLNGDTVTISAKEDMTGKEWVDADGTSYGTESSITVNVTGNLAFSVVDKITCTDGLVFTYDTTTGTYSVTNYTGTAKTVVIPSTYNDGVNGEAAVTSIGDSAFMRLNIIDVTMPESITSIGYRAFFQCMNLESIEIPKNVTSIGDDAFVWCKKITSIEIPSGVTIIPKSAFYYCSLLKTIILPDNITSINDSAFEGCSELTNVKLPNSLTNIGNKAFFGCRNITELNIPANVTSIGVEAFRNCNGLEHLILPAGITSIGDAAFQQCRNLVSVEILSNITSVSYHLFDQCGNLESVKLPSSITSISTAAFSFCGKLKSIIIDSANTTYKSVDGVVYTADGKELVYYPAGKGTSFTIPEGVTSIGASAFNNCESLLSVVIPNGVTSIGGSAFMNCTSLTSIEIPEGVTSIGANAFSGCENLENVVIPASITEIGEKAFFCCLKVTSVNFCGTEEQWNAAVVRTHELFYFTPTPTINYNYVPDT
ncbi:MAG: leucine-rich repeat domain-containing protein [Clostridia bacterium]|nr:leucine-rich repeat domain-containing protein [Clostridia bacterium]